MKITFRSLIAVVALSFLFSNSLVPIATANGPGVCGPENFAGGNGSEENPYLVQDQNALNELRDCGLLGYSYQQTADINLVGNWTPIPTFVGNYDGNGFKITNIVIVGNGNSVGLFAVANNSNLENMEVHGSVSNTGRETGLLAGTISYTTVLSVTAFTNVSGYQDTGGLVGAAYDSNLALITVEPLDENSKVTATYVTIGGVVGYALDTDFDVIDARIDVEGTAGAFNLGGIVGVAGRTDGEEYTHNYLFYRGDVIALNEGSYRCGGIAGATDYAIEDSKVLNSNIVCEHLDIGGIAGYSTNSVARSVVEANVEARKVNTFDGESQVGGIFGYWIPSNGDWQISQSSFYGNLTAEASTGGLVGVMNIANEPSTNTYSISQSYAAGEISSNVYSAGLVGTLVYDTDGPELATPQFSVTQSYTSLSFTNAGMGIDALIYTDYQIEFDSVLWNKSAQNSQSVWGSEIPGVSFGMMKRPFYWSARGFDLTTEWGMNPDIFDGLPVIRENYEGISFDVACQVKSFPAIKFAKNSSKLTKAAKKVAKKIAKQLLTSKCTNILLTGHASGSESKKGKKAKSFQMKLSSTRAQVVSTYLANLLFNEGITLGQSTGGEGATKKLNKDKTKAQQAANRRVVVSTIS